MALKGSPRPKMIWMRQEIYQWATVKLDSLENLFYSKLAQTVRYTF